MLAFSGGVEICTLARDLTSQVRRTGKTVLDSCRDTDPSPMQSTTRPQVAWRSTAVSMLTELSTENGHSASTDACCRAANSDIFTGKKSLDSEKHQHASQKTVVQDENRNGTRIQLPGSKGYQTETQQK